MRHIGESSSRISGRSFSKKYIALGRVINAWPEIVGADLSGKAQPVKIHYRKDARSGNTTTTLDIAVSDADATLMHYQKDLILERINQIFGQSWITALRFVPVPAGSKKAPKKPPTPLTSAQKNHLSKVLEPVEDPDLKINLESLGEAILTKGTP